MPRLSSLFLFACEAVAQYLDSSLSLEEFNSLIEKPNAVGESKLPDPSGFDLSEKWPGTAVQGWKARIEIKANAITTNNDRLTITRISYIPPDDVEIMHNATSDFVATDPTWYPCTNLYILPSLTASPSDEIESCASVLPKDCVDDLVFHFQSGFFGSWNTSWPGAQCPTTYIPDSCDSAFGKVSNKGALYGSGEKSNL